MLIIKDQKQQSFSTDVNKVYLVHIRGASYGDCIRLYVISKTIPMGRVGLPEEVAATIAFLLSDDASYVNATVVPIDGGQSAKY